MHAFSTTVTNRIAVTIVALVISTAAFASGNSFAAEMNQAMATMHRSMGTGYSGDADRDFAAMMIAHHQGAIDMAALELRYGKDERLKRLAQAIIVEQRQEIEVMRGILSEERALPATRPEGRGHMHHPEGQK